jgi:hypothetical protein
MIARAGPRARAEYPRGTARNMLNFLARSTEWLFAHVEMLDLYA